MKIRKQREKICATIKREANTLRNKSLKVITLKFPMWNQLAQSFATVREKKQTCVPVYARMDI